MDNQENRPRYEFARQRQAQNVINEIKGNNDKYENNIIIQSPYKFIDDYLLGIMSKSKSGLKLLDYCCGTGLRSIVAIQNGIDCYGIDISEQSIDICKKRFNEINPAVVNNYIVGNAEKLPYGNNFFDIIISYGSLSYLDFDIAMAELVRVLKNNGTLIILDTTKNNLFINFKRYLKYKLKMVSKYHIENLFDKNKIQILEKRYFSISETKYFHFISTIFIPLPNIKVFNLIKSITLKLDEKLEKTFLKHFYWKFICILKNPIK